MQKIRKNNALIKFFLLKIIMIFNAGKTFNTLLLVNNFVVIKLWKKLKSRSDEVCYGIIIWQFMQASKNYYLFMQFNNFILNTVATNNVYVAHSLKSHDHENCLLNKFIFNFECLNDFLSNFVVCDQLGSLQIRRYNP